MRFHIGLLVIAFLSPSLAAGQSTTADGIRALARGDAAAAARILQPLAEAAQPDPIAQFFLATLYDTGSGVAIDPIRACGLYLKSATRSNPLAKQATLLADVIRRIGLRMEALCSAASIDIEREPSLPVRAQTARPDAIEAFVRGDYPQAAAILKPIAEKWIGEIHGAAGFFMAALYGNGLGLPQDVVRACALYVRSAQGTGPFARLNIAMFEALRPSLTSEQTAECLMLSTIGFNHRFEPAIFNLEPGHWITIDVSNGSLLATVAYQGKERQTEVPIGFLPGMRFLPIQHTELHVGGAGPGRRHFIEFFGWMPGPSGWQSWWSLWEVVRDELVSVAGGFLMTVDGSEPPTPLDLRDLVSLKVNAFGMVEWTIHSGPNAGGDTIETDSERREVEAQQKMRQAADDRVDWKLTVDRKRLPSLRYADADGCADLFVYGWSADRTESIAVRADRAELQLSTTPRTFQISAGSNQIDVSVDVFEAPRRHWNFCTDVRIIDENRQETWRAVAGTVTLQLSPPGIRARDPHKYRATIQIDDAEFVNGSGNRIRSPQPIRLTAIAGPFGY